MPGSLRTQRKCLSYTCPCQDGDPCHYEDHGDTKAMPYWTVKDVLPYGWAVQDPNESEFSDWGSWHKDTEAEAQAVCDRLNAEGYRGEGAIEDAA